MATEVVKTVRASAGDYPSLSAWQAGEQRDLVAADEIAVAECYDDWPTGLADNVVISGFATDAGRHVHVRAAPGSEANANDEPGGPNWSGFFTVGSPFGAHFSVDSDFTKISNIGFSNTGTVAAFTFQFNTGVGCVVENCVGRSLANCFDSVTGTNTFRCCIAYSYNTSTGRGFGLRNNNSVLNCTAILKAVSASAEGYRNLTAAQVIVLKNCVAVGYPNNYVAIDVGDVSNNAADDGATNTPPGTDPYTSNVVDADFADAVNGDYHLSEASGLRGQGVNLYSDFQFDIDGDEWPAAGAWDIGADYYLVAAAAPVLSNIEATGITQTSVTPQVDITFP